MVSLGKLKVRTQIWEGEMYPGLLFELLLCSCITYMNFKAWVMHYKKLNIVISDHLRW